MAPGPIPPPPPPPGGPPPLEEKRKDGEDPVRKTSEIITTLRATKATKSLLPPSPSIPWTILSSLVRKTILSASGTLTRQPHAAA
ncbi:MAG: hypothetical protein Q9214_005971 [Letrouitia sp. 1 TL-2023]